MSDAPLIIGIGNRMRRDDGAGPAVLDAVIHRAFETVEVNGDCIRLIELWDGRPLVHVVDAMRSGADAGTVVRFDAIREPLPRESFLHTSHVFSVAEAVAMSGYLGRRPDRLVVWGIEGADYGHGEHLSAAVEAAVSVVAKRLTDELTEAVDA